VDFDKPFWQSTADMDALRQEDDCDGWRPREHVAFLFAEEDEEFHNLIRKQMVMPFILGDFFPGHSEEAAGGKYFALVKPNANGAPFLNAMGASVDANVRGIVIGSTWRHCSASLAVDESSLTVTDYLLVQCDNFLQFAGQKDGATQCAQIVQLLLANHVDHDGDLFMFPRRTYAVVCAYLFYIS